MEEDDQDIYDDGTSVTNRRVSNIMSMFEPAIHGPKPTPPSKPSVRPPPPKRNDETKITTNGDVKLPPKNNVIPKRNIAEIANKAKDENSNVKKGNDVTLNSELVAKFNSIKDSGNNVNTKPSWAKPSDTAAKPLESKLKSPGKLPIEGLANRVQMFEKGKLDDENETKSGKPQISQIAKRPGIEETKAAISEKFKPKLPTVNKVDTKPVPTPVKPAANKQPPPTPTKSDNTQPPPTPIKPNTKSPTEHTKPFIPGKPKVLPGDGSQNELLQQLRKIKMKGESEQSDEKPQLRSRMRTKSVKRKSLTRLADNKKFYLVEISNQHNEKDPPSKPPKISNVVNLEKIVSEFKRKFSLPDDKDQPVPQGVTEAVEDIYEELPGGDDDDFPPPPPPDAISRPVSTRVVSMIQPMTEDEELEPDDVYDEGFSLPGKESPPPPVIPGRPPRRDLPGVPLPSVREEPIPEPPPKPSISQDAEEDDHVSDDGELYEPLDEVVQEVKKMEEEKDTSSSENKTEQLSEKEKKKREKEEKKRQEQEKKQQEKKMKELKSKFKIDPSDLDPENSKGAGIIKEDAKGKGKDLTVKKDQRVVIICMDKRNPKGKWLVKMEDESDTIGYVDSNNVEVDNTLIRSVMDGTYLKKSSFASMPDNQEEYEAVEPEQDDVYSEAL